MPSNIKISLILPNIYFLIYFLLGLFLYLNFNLKAFIILIFSIFFICFGKIFIKHKLFKESLKAILVILFGYLIIFTHTYYKQHNIKLLQQDQKFITINASVIKVIGKHNQNKRTIIVKNNKTPNKLSLTTKDTKTLINKGDHIKAIVYLFTPKENIAQNSINMQRHAFINNIESYGYIVKIKNIQSSNYKENKLNNLINNVKTNLSNSLVGAFVFFIARLLLASVPYLASNYNIKTIASCLAIAITIFYVILVGLPASAIRALIVFIIFMLSYIFNQELLSYKTFANVALAMLLINPYYVYNAGFVLSFTAYLAILYIIKTKLFYTLNNIKLVKYKAINYIINALFSLIIISAFVQFITLLPVALYFKQVPLYSVFANIVALPLFGILIMPLLFAFAILSYFNFASYLLVIPNFALNIMVKFSSFVASLPYSTIALYNIDYIFIVIFMLALVFMLLNLKTAILLLLISNTGFLFFKAPSIIINFYTQNIMIVNNKTLQAINKTNSFNKNIIMQSYGLNNYKILKFNNTSHQTIKGKEIYLVKKLTNDICHNANLIITQNFIKTNCPHKTINIASYKKGILNIYINNNKITTKYSLSNNKPWNN